MQLNPFQNFFKKETFDGNKQNSSHNLIKAQRSERSVILPINIIVLRRFKLIKSEISIRISATSKQFSFLKKNYERNCLVAVLAIMFLLRFGVIKTKGDQNEVAGGNNTLRRLLILSI